MNPDELLEMDFPCLTEGNPEDSKDADMDGWLFLDGNGHEAKSRFSSQNPTAVDWSAYQS